MTIKPAFLEKFPVFLGEGKKARLQRTEFTDEFLQFGLFWFAHLNEVKKQNYMRNMLLRMV